MNQQCYYYLINGEIKKATSQMPKQSAWLSWEFKLILNSWNASLQPCEISESELDKVIQGYFKISFDNDEEGLTTREANMLKNPIDVTDIVDKDFVCGFAKCIYPKGFCISCVSPKYKLIFKEANQVDSNEMHDLKLDILQILQEEATTQYNPDGKDSRVIDSDEFDTVANQIINLFKTIK